MSLFPNVTRTVADLFGEVLIRRIGRYRQRHQLPDEHLVQSICEATIAVLENATERTFYTNTLTRIVNQLRKDEVDGLTLRYMIQMIAYNAYLAGGYRIEEMYVNPCSYVIYDDMEKTVQKVIGDFDRELHGEPTYVHRL